jgi:uncharacterized protein
VKKRKLLLIGFIVVLAIIGFFIIKNHIITGNTISNSESSHLKRENPVYEMKLKEHNGTIDVYNLNFKSKNFLNYSTKIYGLLFMPHDKENVSAIILLPGGGVKKEQEAELSLRIANLGYVVLTFDQRGIGETGGIYLDIQTDYDVFSHTGESIQYLSVYDPLLAFDILNKIKAINKNNIAIAGESMGGRYAIIAAAMEKRLRGVIAISTSGFHIKDTNYSYSPYLISIDPDSYIGKISPNKVFMLQGTNDSVVLMKDAETTFSLAKEPKKFFVAQNCQHGFCEGMFEELKRDLGEMF